MTDNKNSAPKGKTTILKTQIKDELLKKTPVFREGFLEGLSSHI